LFISFHFFALVVLFHLKGPRGEGKGLTLRDHITQEDWGKIAGLEKFEETEEDKSIVESCRVITSSSGGWLPPLRELYLPEIPPSPSGPRFRDKFREMEEMMHSKFAELQEIKNP